MPLPVTRDSAIFALRRISAAIYRGEQLTDSESQDLSAIADWLQSDGTDEYPDGRVPGAASDGA